MWGSKHIIVKSRLKGEIYFMLSISLLLYIRHSPCTLLWGNTTTFVLSTNYDLKVSFCWDQVKMVTLKCQCAYTKIDACSVLWEWRLMRRVICIWVGSSGKTLLGRWHLSWSWDGWAFSSQERMLQVVGKSDCLTAVKKYQDVFELSSGHMGVKFEGISKHGWTSVLGGRLQHCGDSDPSVSQLPLARTHSVSEQRVSHHREQLAMLSPVHSKAITEYLRLLAKADQLWGPVIHSCGKEWAWSLLGPFEPFFTRKVANLRDENWYKNTNKSSVLPFMKCPSPLKHVESLKSLSHTLLSGSPSLWVWDKDLESWISLPVVIQPHYQLGFGI